jgi:ATP-dependent Clp protease ATP-binding subunit ClpB
MELELGKRLIGQKEAVSAVSRAIRRSRAGISEEGKPIGTFLFLGPTGVGKTELAKSLSEFMFSDEHLMIRLDMSVYMDKHSVARLIGSPPGYIGHDEGGQLTEAVRRHPYSVVLFDEIEKAHPDVFNILLQVLDDGHLTDSRGRTVNFKNTVLIMTSNLASHTISEFASNPEKQRKEVELVLKHTFKPEFLNRIDEAVIFQNLTERELEQIVEIQMKKVEERLLKKNISLKINKEILRHLSQAGYNPAFGARPLKRLIQNEILDELSLLLIEGKIKKGDLIHIGLNKNKVSFQKKEAQLIQNIV